MPALRFLEFFTANIRNKNTRLAYARAVAEFLNWREERGLQLHTIEPMAVAAYVEQLWTRFSAPTVKQNLAAIRMLFNWLVIGQVVPVNPAAAVRGPKHVVKRGKTPVLTAEQARELLDSIDTRTIIGLRDRALIGIMVYTFSRVGAVVTMKVEDYYQDGKRWWFRLHEKGGKRHEGGTHWPTWPSTSLSWPKVWRVSRSHDRVRRFVMNNQEPENHNLTSSQEPNPPMHEPPKPKRTCLGRTHTFKRCGSLPGAKRLFCHQHRFQRWAFPLFLLTLAATVAGLYQDALGPLFFEEPAERRIMEIEKAREKLQDELEKTKERSIRLLGGVEVATNLADSYARSSPEIAPLVETLEGLVKDFEADLDIKELSDVNALRLRLANATLANATGRFQVALELVTSDDAKTEREATEAQIDREVKTKQVRGDAFDGLRNWQQALACYERILELRPDRWSTRRAAGLCRWSLGQLDQALEHSNALVDHYTRLVEQQGRTELENHLAGVLNNRGITLDAQGKLDDAIKDYDKAIVIRSRLVEQQGRTELENDLASVLNNRGGTLHAQGKLDDAIKDYDKAIVIRSRLVEQQGRTELENDLAMALNNRGIAHTKKMHFELAFADVDRALKLRKYLVEDLGMTHLASELGKTKALRELILRLQSEQGSNAQNGPPEQ